MELVIPSEDVHWEIQDGYVDASDEDETIPAGGYALAYAGRRDKRVVFLQYEERAGGGWYGFIQWSVDMPDHPTEVWQNAYGLYDELPEPELTEHYNECVAPLSDSEFLSALHEYESGAMDFVGSLESDAPRLADRCIWCGECPVSTAEDARRYMENTLSALSVDL
jgi:hypothetical protein